MEAEPRAAVDMSDHESLGMRLLLGGWLDKTELDNVPWWPQDTKRSRKRGAQLDDAVLLEEADLRDADRRALTGVGQVWMRAVDEIVGDCM